MQSLNGVYKKLELDAEVTGKVKGFVVSEVRKGDDFDTSTLNWVGGEQDEKHGGLQYSGWVMTKIMDRGFDIWL